MIAWLSALKTVLLYPVYRVTKAKLKIKVCYRATSNYQATRGKFKDTVDSRNEQTDDVFMTDEIPA